MHGLKGFGRFFTASVFVLLTILTACSKDPILGVGGITARLPTVTNVTPRSGAVGVAVTNPVVSATFSEPMKPLVPANFTLTCAAPCASATGTVTLDSANTIATFTPALSLTANTLYTATVSGAPSLSTGLALARPYIWTFTTATPSAPTVTATAPVNNASGVAINLSAVTAQFDQPMAPISGGATFTLTCTAPCVNPTGTVTLDSTGTVATLTRTSGALLGETVYTATITGATSLATGAPLANPYVWTFTTGVAGSATRPRVTVTVPATTTPGPTTGVPSNTTISAVFSEDMKPATVTAASFTVTCTNPCVSPSGTVTYNVGSRTAVFMAQAALTAGATYTATISTAAMDLQGNALAGNQAALPAPSNYIWTFTSAAPTTATPVSVMSTNPTAGRTAVCPNASINATFAVAAGLRMNPSTIKASTFTVTGPSPTLTPITASSVTLDSATGTVATFTPQNALTAGTTYTATIIGGPAGVMDSAIPADTMTSNFVWMFTAGPATSSCAAPVPLNSVSTYGSFGGTAGLTNTGILTVINGDIGTIATGTSSITGFHDTAGDVYTESPANIGAVNGTIFTCTNSTTGPNSAGPNAANCAAAMQAKLDAQTAYNTLVAFPPGANPGGNLGSLTLAPGVYTAPSGSLLLQGGDLTLDAQGNANAVWVFQMATTLTVGGPGAMAPQSIVLVGGAQAKNVFWQVGTSAIINAGGGGTVVGTIIAQQGVVFSTAGNTTITTLNGRALSLVASVTMVDTVVNVPAP